MGVSAHAVEEWLTVAQVAAMLRKSRSFVHKAWPRWKVDGVVRPSRVGGTPRGRLLFRMSEVEEMLEKWQVS